MNYRSTNVLQGGSALGGALLIGAEAGSGIEFNPTSSGNAPNIMPACDETNLGIGLFAKGSGTITIGNSSNPVSIGGGTTFKGFFASTYTVQFAAISSGQTLEAALSTAFGSFAPGDLVMLETLVTPSEIAFGGFRLAADASTRLTMVLHNPGSTAGSTGRVTGRIVWADLT